jgi:hypothetical protein
MIQHRLYDVNASEVHTFADAKMCDHLQMTLDHNVCHFAAHLTPKQARQLAANLVACAKEMEGK